MADEMSVRRVLRLGLGGAAILAILWSACAHVTHDGETTLVVRFGRPVRVDQTAGLHVNLPWPIEVVVRLDMRRQVLETGLTEMLTRDKKNIVMVNYALWRIEDPLRFVQAVGTMDRVPSALLRSPRQRGHRGDGALRSLRAHLDDGLRSPYGRDRARSPRRDRARPLRRATA